MQRLFVVVVGVRRRGEGIVASHHDEAEDNLRHNVDHGVGAHLERYRKGCKALGKEPHHL